MYKKYTGPCKKGAPGQPSCELEGCKVPVDVKTVVKAEKTARCAFLCAQCREECKQGSEATVLRCPWYRERHTTRVGGVKRLNLSRAATSFLEHTTRRRSTHATTTHKS